MGSQGLLYSSIILIKMAKLLFLTLLSLAAGGRVPRSADHHGDGHDDNCVDISRYGPVLYNESNTEVCSYKMKTECTKRSREVCVTIPITECEVVGYTHCENIPTITEMKKMPVCQNITKQQCDSKWVVNELGEKVWAGNENCQEVTWEDCVLEDRIVTQEVDVWECTPATQPISYQTHTVNTVDVSTYNLVCQPRANSVCSHSSEVKCETVEWEDCSNNITPHCFAAGFKVPYQEYDHRLRCSVGHH